MHKYTTLVVTLIWNLQTNKADPKEILTPEDEISIPENSLEHSEKKKYIL